MNISSNSFASLGPSRRAGSQESGFSTLAEQDRLEPVRGAFFDAGTDLSSASEIFYRTESSSASGQEA